MLTPPSKVANLRLAFVCVLLSQPFKIWKKWILSFTHCITLRPKIPKIKIIRFARTFFIIRTFYQCFQGLRPASWRTRWSSWPPLRPGWCSWGRPTGWSMWPSLELKYFLATLESSFCCRWRLCRCGQLRELKSGKKTCTVRFFLSFTASLAVEQGSIS